MKNFLLLMFLFLLVYAPFLASREINNYYERYEAIAKKYECYPVETCKADFNGDGKLDRFMLVDEPNEVYLKNYYRLKIYVEENNQPKEILNIRYDGIDNTYRTHIAVVEQFGEKKLIIYDTINKEQFYVWDGSRLSPIWDGKELDVSKERAILEREIQKAMALEDDTGGFNEKIMFRTSIYSHFVLYYLMLLTTVGIFLYFSRKSKPKLS